MITHSYDTGYKKIKRGILYTATVSVDADSTWQQPISADMHAQ